MKCLPLESNASWYFSFPVINTNMAAVRICEARITLVLLNEGSLRSSNKIQLPLDSFLEKQK
jgi:hypothetical protein